MGSRGWNFFPHGRMLRVYVFLHPILPLGMVRLNRIYTKTGDDGSTALGDGSRLPKHHLRIDSYGTVDELSSVIGLALSEGVPAPSCDWLAAIQNDLFDVGSDLCVPGQDGDRGRLSAVYTERLEAWIDELNADLEDLTSFILPGGSKASAWMHLARTVCRRAERLVSELGARDEEKDRVNGEVLRYLNRLSDLLFVMGRACNDGGRADILWKPGQGQG
ncbi:MAG: cob(I)alamin adenosyltransferase [Planctomycetota bacterium]|jgi:cob(I)alamin adenosyltransferase